MRAYAVKKYLETKSLNATILDFVTKFNPTKPPYKSLIVKWVAKFRTKGTVRNLNSITPGRKSHSGRKRKRDEAFIESLRESVQESPHRSTRRRYQGLDTSRSTMLIGTRCGSSRMVLLPIQLTRSWIGSEIIWSPGSSVESVRSSGLHIPPTCALQILAISKVYQNKPETLEELKNNIETVIRGMKRPILKSVCRISLCA